MKNYAKTAVLALVLAISAVATPAHAFDVVISQQLIDTTEIDLSQTQFQWNIGTGLVGYIPSILDVYVQMPSDRTRVLYAELQCYNNSGYTAPCGNGVLTSATTSVVNASLQIYTLTFPATTTPIFSTKYYRLRVFGTGGINYGFQKVMGTSTPNACVLGGCTGTPYYVLSATFVGAPEPQSLLNEYYSTTTVQYNYLSGYATTTCGITNITGCFQNALAFLFFPSQSVINQYQSLYDTVKEKPPFGYVFVYVIALQSLTGTASSTVSLQIEDNIQDNIFTPLRTALSTILWLLFAIWFYNRVRKIDI